MEKILPIIPNDQFNILLDKVAIYNFNICDFFDIEELARQDIVTIEKNPKRYLKTNSGQKYKKIELDKCNYFDVLIGSIAKNGEPFARMELSVHDEKTRNLNCITVEEVKEKINEAERYLADELGILCDFTDAKIKYLEMNKTFEIELDSVAYDRVLKTMINIMPKVASKIKKPVTSNKKTYSASNKSQTEIVTIYDKSEQLKQVHQIETNTNLLRFEMKLINDANKIKTRFGSAYLRDLDENMIDKYCADYIQTNFIEPYEKLLAFQKKTVEKILKDNYKQNDKEWIDNVLHIICDFELTNEIPLMFDIGQMKEWLNCLGLPKQNKYYIYKRFEEKCVNYNTVFKNGDIAKYEEILGKIEVYFFD